MSAKKKADKRTMIRQAEAQAREATRRAEALREELFGAHTKLPAEGSKWRKHAAMLRKFDPDWVYTFLMWAFAENGSDQLAVIERVADGKPFRRVIPMETFVVEWVEVRRGRRT